MARRDLLAPCAGYERGSGFRGFLTTRETLKAIAVVVPLLGVGALIQIWFGNRVPNDLMRIILAVGFGIQIVRTLRRPQRLQNPPETPGQTFRLRLLGAAALIVLAALFAISLHDLFVPE